MEELDRRLVGLLLSDGRMSYTDLARATGLSTSAVHQRVRRLEERGVVTGYTAVVSPEALGLPVTALVSVAPFEASAPDDVPQRLEHLTEIEDCYSVAGVESYILKVRVSTPSDLENLLARIRTAASVSTHTTVVLSTPWEGRTRASVEDAAGQAIAREAVEVNGPNVPHAQGLADPVADEARTSRRE